MNAGSPYKVLFINPPLENIVKMEMSESIIEEMGYYPPLGLLYLATYLKEKADFPVDIRIVDCVPERLGYEELRRIIIAWAPDVCAVTTFTPTIVDALLTCKLIKEVNPAIKTVLGGHHVDSYPKETLASPYVDFICRGEGEMTFLELVRALREGRECRDVTGLGYKRNGELFIDSRFSYISDLDGIPIPDRNFINNHLYTCSLGTERTVATVMSSRGCPYQCTFCYCPTKKYRIRSVNSIIEELSDIAKRGITEVFFFDDLFNSSSERVISISQGILDEGLRIKWSFRGRINNITDRMLKIAKRSGCQRIHYGIETSSDDRLRRIKKNITVGMIEDAMKKTRVHGITIVGSFMIGLPGETRQEIFETFAFMKRLRLDYAQISVLMPYPHTELYNDGIKKGILTRDFWREFAEDPIGLYRGFQPQVWTEIIPQSELFKLINVGYKKFYLRPSYIIKSLIKTRSFKELLSKAHGAWVVLKEGIRDK